MLIIEQKVEKNNRKEKSTVFAKENAKECGNRDTIMRHVLPSFLFSPQFHQIISHFLKRRRSFLVKLISFFTTQFNGFIQRNLAVFYETFWSGLNRIQYKSMCEPS